MLEQLAELIPSNYTQACDLAHRWVQQIGVAQFKKATGIIHMNCRVSRKGTLLSTEEYTTVLKTVRKTQLQVLHQGYFRVGKMWLYLELELGQKQAGWLTIRHHSERDD